ncbi:hypothetical protein K440DRAFT_654090 [Wilcoxina mikolae CBS 423.85]|nr:hypothetical protein K440DRAFT_654090 [Wilcoxina mikolae CBS 423.85]
MYPNIPSRLPRINARNQLSAAHLQVSRAFLLQQAAWLYERELSQIQAQMRKVGAASLNTNLPVPPAPAASSVPQSPATPVLLSARPAVSGFEPRITSALSMRSGTTSGSAPTPRSSPAPQLLSNRPAPRPVSRHTSDATIGRQTQLQPAAHRFSNPLLDNDDEDNSPASQNPPAPSSVSEESTVESTSSSSEDEGDNRLIRRLPLFLKKQHSLGSEDEGGDEEPFLPFSAGDANYSPRDNAMGGTVTLRPRQSSDNSGLNGLDSSRPGADGFGLRNSARRRSGIQLGSPRRRAVTDSAGPSSPSMGSSFSDLSDASVSQSAMEEAYLSTMQAGGLGSRISTIGRAVGSRYFHSQP